MAPEILPVLKRSENEKATEIQTRRLQTPQDKKTESLFGTFAWSDRLPTFMRRNVTTTCTNPYTGRGGAYACGQCTPCRLKRRREWTHRIMLEAGIYADNAFVTLTYDPKKHEDAAYSLQPGDLTAFLKALRKKIYPMKIRYYAVGEYGDKSEHAHFHLALFGYPSCKRKRRTRGLACTCSACSLLRQAWQKGFILNGDLEIASARYVARYVVKKMTRWDDPRLHNRHPEFCRMSLKPGIGHGVLDNVAAVITRYNLLTPEGDVPVTLRHGSTEYPLGRYLRKQLRKKLGLNEKAPDAVIKKYSDELLPLRMAARSDPQNPSFKAHLLQASKGKMAQVISRHHLFKRKGSL